MSIEFGTRPVRRSRGPDAGVLLVVGLAAFVGLAVLKPWDSGPTDANPHPSASRPTAASPDIGPTALPTPAGSDGREQLDRLWSNAQGILEDLPVHSEVGVRVITEPEPGQADGPQPDGSVVTSLVGGTLVERWYRADAFDAGASWWMPSTWLTGVTADRPALAVGVTTGDIEAPLDHRFYRYSAIGGAPIAVAAAELGPPYDLVGLDRLFFAPYEGAVLPAWPSGRYVVQVLFGSGIASIGFTLPEGPQPIPVIPDPLPYTPTAETVRAALAGQPDGVFAIEGSGEASVVVAQAGRQLDPRRAWLAMAAPEGADGPRVAMLLPRSAAILGVVLPQGSVLQAASLWAVAPQVRPLAASRIGGTDALSPPAVAFTPPGGGAWAAGLYRITARYWDPGYRLQEWSWHLSLGGGFQPDSFLIVAAAAWTEPARQWAVISTPVEPALTRGMAEPLEAPVQPRLSVSVPERLGEECPGSAHVDRASPVVGLRIPGDTWISSVRLLRRFDGGRSLVLPVQRSLVPSTRLVLLAQPRSAPRYWRDGIYDLEVTLTSDSAANHAPARAPAYMPLCIGDLAAETSVFRMRPGSASTAAYEAALAMPGVTMLAP